ncbi:type II toxin-antitoxin system RelE/ParE family toxin [Tolypothrix campylonemoides VB511288]|nr:type II toxin-antitoxin system RelE/ParE family toxin [Tolypothrix campylonemoides VB511288]
MSYQIEFTPAALRQLRKLPKDIQKRIAQKVDELAFEPRPDGVVKLENIEFGYRVHVGKYRILYQIQDDLLLVTVVKVGHRKEVYR